MKSEKTDKIQVMIYVAYGVIVYGILEWLYKIFV